MKDSTVYTKTPAGQQEILDRKLRLHPRLRTLLVLIDGRRLAELMIDFDVGVATARTYHVQRIDSDYFEEE